MSAARARGADDRPHPAIALVAAVLVLGPVALAFASGGYFDGPRATAALGAAVVLVVLALAAPARALLPATTAGRVALAGFAVLALWVAVSRDRSSVPDVAGDDAERVALYTAFLAAGAVAWRSRAAARLAEPGVAFGVLVVLLYGLAGRWLPGVVDLEATVSAGGRLEQPLTYWNATGMLAAFGAVLSVRMAGDPERRGALRAGAAAAVVPLACGVYLSFSRGAAAALVAGLVVLVLCAPDRAQLRALATTLVPAAVAVVASALLPGVRALEGSMGDRERDGLVALAVTLAAMAVAAAVTAHLVRTEARGGRRTDAFRLPKAARWALAVLVVAVVVGPVLVSHREGGSPAQAKFGASTKRFASVSSNRYEYWRVALRTWADHPVTGVGSGAWATEWLRERPIAETARDAHSVELETLAELGLVGALALALAFGGIARCALTLQRRDPGLAAGACAGLAVWAAHSALDWDWEMPAATLPALTLAGVVLARARPRDEPSAGPAAAGAVARVVPRVLVVALAGVIAVTALAARRGDDRCTTAADAAQALFDAKGRGDAQGVVDRVVARCSTTRPALSALNYVVLSGHAPEVLAGVRAITRDRPEDALAWTALSGLETDPARARAARARAHDLNPLGVPAPGRAAAAPPAP